MPTLLNDAVSSDGNMFLVKDGIRECNDSRYIRYTLIIKESKDKPINKRTEKLARILRELKQNNQIVEYSCWHSTFGQID
jgi:hypothetical protein